jgi:ketosteroid isomerase-like protein
MTTEQRGSESAIRALIERWATAVHAGDLDRVLADHSEDIQMFDVPPPKEGSRWLVSHEHHSFRLAIDP